ncbi:uncharacterized protein LOC125232304 [Leguminivora glycinivorella]|uniref:uncharacterized protein LOC125232304 n=1 Tax=Leguminivora glycinivorella TaxID=1035111 RepID=UPI00200C4C59|nr:uncharacterized protein LOC125232304 [Leguminivora glycinivorella]
MRRGHSGIGGWRNENPRHFWPRGGGVPRHGPPQQYPLLDLPAKYGVPRFNRGGPHYNPHMGPNLRMRGVDRRSFGPHDNRPRFPGPNDRYNYQPPHLRNDDTSDTTSYKNIVSYCESRKNDQSRINSMGDVDHRQNFNSPHTQKPYGQHPISPWANPPPEGRPGYDDRGHRRPSQYHDNVDGNIPSFTSHRPPSSDHYGTNVASAIDNSNSFSRSVDDTVDIVRKRLLNRNESHNNTDHPPDQDTNERTDSEAAPTTLFQSEPQTPPARKRIQRRRQNAQSNCDKIKNKIVHQLFKMDKEKLNKLMDNPNSSSKFEYAISSLITESQNSLDRHLRSVAEKSLCSSSTEFIHDDNNTIYEDTFLKQMQCILEPQDTVLLEDIKPLVMAELNKVLQLDDFDQRFERGDEDPSYYPSEESAVNTDYPNNYAYDNVDFSNDVLPNYPEEENQSYYEDRQYSPSNFPEQDTPESPRGHEQNEQYSYNQSSKLFERRTARKSCDYSQLKKQSAESRDQMRRSIDEERNRFNDARRKLVTPPPVFDANIEHLSEEDDPFADLDKQYHVAVDHNFIESELDKQYIAATEKNSSKKENEIKTQLISFVEEPPLNKPIKKEVLLSPEIDPVNIKKEIDNQLLNIAKSPLKLSSSTNKDRKSHRRSHSKSEKKKDDSDVSVHDTSHVKDEYQELNTENIKHEYNPDVTDSQESSRSETSSTVKSTIAPNSRKRSIDQKPSHRKEKRKKSDVSPEANKQILNKNIIINVNDCGSKSTEKKCDAAIFNLFFSKDESGKELPKESKTVESSDKAYSDKYVKRKETPKKKEDKRKRSSNSHSIVSPKDTNNSSSEAQPKTDSKNKLRTIDMFLSHPVKVSNVHQARRNTAQAPAIKKEESDKSTSHANKLIKRSVGTQMIHKTRNKETQATSSKSSSSKLCQTEFKKFATKSIQTDPVVFEKSRINSSDTFERMKEIDLEIQVLLQEKFKLYNSIETKESCSNAIQNLGMTVLNVTPIEDGKDDANDDVLSEDVIVDNFTSIPVEELEQIALESVQDIPTESPKKTKRSQRRAVIERQRKNSQSPTVRNKSNKKLAAPNISLIEQIITDDRPLEDIISLDDFENPTESPVTKKSKSKKAQKSKSKKQPKKPKSSKPVVKHSEFTLKECQVVLTREDLSKYMSKSDKSEEPPQELIVKEPEIQKEVKVQETEIQKEVKVQETEIQKEVIEVPDVEKTVDAADMLDMLDVSEDIVIGDNCEIKSDKETERISIGDDIILDNSQSSSDDVAAVDGQSEDECKMFDYSSDEALKRESITVTGNADAVLAIEAIDNNFVAACLDGNVYHFNSDGQLLATLRGSNLAVTCLIIVKEKYGTTVYTGSLDSRIRYYDLETGLEKGPECNVLSPIQTMDRAWDTVYVGTRTGFVTQYECKNNMLIPRSTMKFSEQSILCLRALKEGPRKVLLVAARSENVTIKDAQTGLLMRTLEGPRMTVYTLVFEEGKVYCGTSSHQIHVFEYNSGSHCGTHEGGKGAVCLRATGGLLFAGCYDGCVYVYREGNTRPIAQLRGPGLMLLSLAVVGTKIIAGYKDRSLYIWKIPLSILKEMIL